LISKKKFKSIGEIQRLQQLATQCECEVAIHSPDGTIRVDAKSFIGMFALDFESPVFVVSESKAFHKKIQALGENLD
jgi:phosphotransferase system HPr-like phosphotransfer protein